MTPIRFYIGLAIALLIGVAAALFGADYRRLRVASIQNESRGQVLVSTSQGVEEGIDLDEFQAGYTAALNANRDIFQRSKQEAKRNEPETAARAATTVPDSVRNAYRARRLARERLGCAGRQCPQDDDANAAAKR